MGLGGGFLGATVGGGGLITNPCLIFVGLTPHQAIAATKFGAIGSSSSSLIRYWREGVIHWKLSVPFSVISLFGAWFGARLLLDISPEVMKTVIGLVILAMLPIVLFKKDIGIRQRIPKFFALWIGWLCVAVLAVYGGFFGAGSGTLLLYLVMICFGLPVIEAKATDSLPWLATSVASFFVLYSDGQFLFRQGIVLFVGMIVGGWLGAHSAVVKGNAWVLRLFSVMVVASAARLLLW